MATYIEKHTVVTKDTLNVDHNSRETFQHVKFMNPENIYMGTFMSKGYKFEDLVSHNIYDVVLSGGYAVISGDNSEVAIVNADQIKDLLDERTVSSYGAIPSLPLISALNDAINKRITHLDNSTAKLSGNNDISGYNRIEELDISSLSAAQTTISSLAVVDGLSANMLSVQSLNDIIADGETLSSVLSDIGADVEALEDEMHKADLSIVLKLNDAVDNLIDRENTISAQLSDEVIQLSTNLSTDIDSLSAALSTDYVDKIGTALTSANSYTDTVSALLSTDILNVSVAADAIPADGYLKTYIITQGGIERGKINIPKDFLVKSGSVKTVVEPDEPYEGAKVGDKYIDLVINSKDSEPQAEGEHLYIPVNSLVDIYEGYDGNCISTAVVGNIISADINLNSIAKDKLSSDVLSSLSLADSSLQLSDIIDISASTESVDAAANAYNVKKELTTLSSYITTIKYFDNDPVSAQLSVVKLSAEDYYALVAADATISNALYVVEDTKIDAYGQQIKNIAAPTDLSDAATKEYVDDGLSRKQDIIPDLEEIRLSAANALPISMDKLSDDLKKKIDGKRDYLDLTYNTKRKVAGPAWELKYRRGDVTDTATLYVVESGTSGGYDYESWSGTSANNLSVTFQLVGHNDGGHGGSYSWGTTNGNLSSVSLDTTSFEGPLISGEKVSEYEVEDKDNLALESQLTEATRDINSKIPDEASADNQLADKAWVEGKRGKLDLAVYEETIAEDYWKTVVEGSEVTIPLASRSGMESVYKNGEANGSFKIMVSDYLARGGAFRVTVQKYQSGVWANVVTKPETAYSKITHVEQTSGGSLVFDYKGEPMPVPTEDTLAKKSETVPTSRTVNGQALNEDVTLTGAVIAVSRNVSTTIDAALAGKASKSDAALTPIEFTEWTLTADDQEVQFDFYGYTDGQWYFVSDNPELPFNVTFEGSEKAVYLEVVYNDQTWRASRMALGYRLGQSLNNDKPVASEAEAEALRTGKQDALTFDATPTAGSNNPVKSGGIKTAIDEALQLADVIDDRLVPTEGPGTSVIHNTGSSAVSYLASNLPLWSCNGTSQSSVERNRGASEQYWHYDPSLFPDRIVFWVEGKDNGDQGVFTRSIVFPKSGVYTLNIEYAVGYTKYPDSMGQARFVVDAGTSGAQDVIGINDTSIVQHAQVQFAATAGAGNITIKGKTGLAGNACCVVIASVKVTLIKEIGIEIGDIVAPDASAQTGQAADAKATGDALAEKVSRAGDTMTGMLTTPKLTVGTRASGSSLGDMSVAEGSETAASGAFAHAEGLKTVATNRASHAEGVSSSATGAQSHTEGFHTSATNPCEHAEGSYNVSHQSANESGATLHSIGIGTADNNRKNAVETMKSGKTFILGIGGYDGTNPTSAIDLAAVVNAKAARADNPTDGNLAALDTNGNPVDSGKSLDDISQEIADAGFVTVIGNACHSDRQSTTTVGFWDWNKTYERILFTNRFPDYTFYAADRDFLCMMGFGLPGAWNFNPTITDTYFILNSATQDYATKFGRITIPVNVANANGRFRITISYCMSGSSTSVPRNCNFDVAMDGVTVAQIRDAHASMTTTSEVMVFADVDSAPSHLLTLSADNTTATSGVVISGIKVDFMASDFETVAPSTDASAAGKAADAKATGEALDGKRDKLDLAVYEESVTEEYWRTAVDGAEVTIPLVSRSGMESVYQNGEASGSFKVQVSDYRGIGGVFRVTVHKYESGDWAVVVTEPETAYSEITHVEQTQGGNLAFDYVKKTAVRYGMSRPTTGNFGISAWRCSAGATELKYVWDADRTRWVATGVDNGYITGYYINGSYNFTAFDNGAVVGSWTGLDAEAGGFQWTAVTLAFLSDVPRTDLLIAKTWGEIKTLRDNGNLVPGQQYRITDYVATTNGDMESQSANHRFDIIVTADDERTLNEHARAIMHVGDTYFAGCDLAAWDVWYCLDNDTNRFAWADSTNGKGVIYHLIDEFQNDCPYDFKGIQFKAYGDTDNIWRYTFDSGTVNNNTDLSKSGFAQSVYKNTISPYSTGKWKLNRIVFKGSYCNYNTFGSGCSANTFGEYCNYNTFDSGCSSNTFGSYCDFNTFGSGCSSNTFGMYCLENTFGSGCSANTFGMYCNYNTFVSNCRFNAFGSYCNYNAFGSNCSNNTFGSVCCVGNWDKYVQRYVGTVVKYDNALRTVQKRYRSTFSYSQTYLVGETLYYQSKYWECTAEHRGAWNVAHFTEIQLVGVDGILSAEEYVPLSYYRYVELEDGVSYVALDCTGDRGDGVYYQNVTVSKGVGGTESAPKHIEDSSYSQSHKTTYQPANSEVISI